VSIILDLLFMLAILPICFRLCPIVCMIARLDYILVRTSTMQSTHVLGNSLVEFLSLLGGKSQLLGRWLA
jgi:hypothetical protein